MVQFASRFTRKFAAGGQRSFHASTHMSRKKGGQSNVWRTLKNPLWRMKRRREPMETIKLREKLKTPFSRPLGWDDQGKKTGGVPDTLPPLNETYMKLMGNFRYADTDGAERLQGVKDEEAFDQVRTLRLDEIDLNEYDDPEPAAANQSSEYNGVSPGSEGIYEDSYNGASAGSERIHGLGDGNLDYEDLFRRQPSHISALLDELPEPANVTTDIKHVVKYSEWRRSLEVSEKGKLATVFFQRRPRSADAYLELMFLLRSLGRGAEALTTLRSARNDGIFKNVTLTTQAAVAAAEAGLVEDVENMLRVSGLPSGSQVGYDMGHQLIRMEDWIIFCKAEALAVNGDVDGIVDLMITVESEKEYKQMLRDEGPLDEFAEKTIAESPRSTDGSQESPPTTVGFIEGENEPAVHVLSEPEDSGPEEFLPDDADLQSEEPEPDDRVPWDQLGKNRRLWSALIKALGRQKDRLGMRIAYFWYRDRLKVQYPLLSSAYAILMAEGGVIRERRLADREGSFAMQVLDDVLAKNLQPTPEMLDCLVGETDYKSGKWFLDWAKKRNVQLGHTSLRVFFKAIRNTRESTPDEILERSEDFFEEVVENQGGIKFVMNSVYGELMANYSRALILRVLQERDDDEEFGTRVTGAFDPTLSQELEKAQILMEVAQTNLEELGTLLVTQYISILLWANKVEEAVAVHRKHFVPATMDNMAPGLPVVWATFLDQNPEKVSVDTAYETYKNMAESGVLVNPRSIFALSRFFCLKKDFDKAEEVTLQLRYVPGFRASMKQTEYLQQLAKLVKDSSAFVVEMHSLGVAINRERTYISKMKNQHLPPQMAKYVDYHGSRRMNVNKYPSRTEGHASRYVSTRG